MNATASMYPAPSARKHCKNFRGHSRRTTKYPPIKFPAAATSPPPALVLRAPLLLSPPPHPSPFPPPLCSSITPPPPLPPPTPLTSPPPPPSPSPRRKKLNQAQQAIRRPTQPVQPRLFQSIRSQQ